MTRMSLVAIVLLVAGPAWLGFSQPQGTGYTTQTSRFVPVVVSIDPSGVPLAAYQFELRVAAGTARIVGVEGGEHPAFKAPPYYDPAALAQDRIIIGAYSLEPNLPVTRTSIAVIHMQVLGDVEPQYEVTLSVACDPTGQAIAHPHIDCEQGERR